ncbi:BTB/POZ domain-containing protein [Hirsutella rhossiliensis]|uniref:BTB/POZ domain-containing protein n=1 Tax=Hirsutella rhossiliensis TaxID=111463 RepID=A0A9P8MPN5_9HYPO|nr:BTB/POZ domain-containing protein [Hirsutella rhossiliensis]KAH0957896.1 BTB/POZ domain-containing protein [Hirsutella rhossiliensis]
MFGRRLDSSSKSFSKGHGKASKSSSSFSRDSGVSKRRHEPRHRRPTTASTAAATEDTLMSNNPTSAIVTLVVGAEQRLFAAHEDVLCSSSAFFLNALRSSYPESATKRISLADEEPVIFSSVLEYLYKGDYFPRLKYNKRRNSWELESTTDEEGGAAAAAGRVESTVYHRGVDGDLLKDTVIYCAAQRYGLEELKKLALRKQGLQSGIQCSTILASARYAYANTPDNDSKLRAHYLALIIRSRGTFKRSGTMQLEMYNGGTQLFFDLFVALCNHVDDISSAQSTPRSNRHLW